MEYFAGLDVSMEETHVCVVTRNGTVIHEAKVPSTPASIAAALARVPSCQWVLFETRMAPMLYHGLSQLGLPVVCVGKRSFRAPLPLAGTRQSRRMRSFLIEPPRAIPVGGRRVGLEEVDAADKRAGRPVVGNSLKCRAKCATRFVPLACPICGKALRISGPQQ